MDGTPEEKARENLRGALAMLGSTGLFIVNDAMIKLASEGLPPAQTIGVRGVFATIWVMLAVTAAGLWGQVPHALERRTLTRAALDVGSTFTYLVALFHMPIALAVAIGQTAPLMVLLLSRMFLGERIPWNRGVAMLAGFAAVLLVVRPSGDGVDPGWAALSLLATLFGAGRDVYTRVVPPRIPSLVITLASAVVITSVAVTLIVIEGWQPMAWWQWGLVLASSLFLAGGYYTVIVAMRLGEVSFTGGFRYAALPAGALLGWAIWGQLPDLLAVVGMAMIVAAGLYVFRSGRRI